MATIRAAARAIRPDQSSQSAIAPVVGLVTLAAGIAVLLMGTVLQDLRPLPVPVEIHAETASRVAAEQFYAAQDIALTTGDPYLLITSVDPEFVDHRPGLTVPLDRAGIVDEVIALRGTVPDLRVAAEPLLVDDDRVLVYVSRHPADPAVSVGRMAAFEHIIGDTLEVVRVTDGGITERWSFVPVPATGPSTLVAPDSVGSAWVTGASADPLVCLASGCH